MLTHAAIIALSLMVQPAEKPTAQPKPESAAPAAAPGTEFLESPELTTLATGLKFAEGPQWRSDGKLVFCDMQGDTIYAINPADDKKARTPADGLEIVRKGSERAIGTAFDAKGLMVNCHFSGQVTRTDAEGKVTVLAKEIDGKQLNMPNDLTVRSDGTIYFGDFGKGRDEKHIATFGLYRIDPMGKVTLESKDVTAPNGVALSPDEKRLYVGLYSKAQLMVFDVASDGSLSGGKIFAELNDKEPKGRSAPDGVRTDMAGNVWTTGAGGIWVYDAAGKRLGTIAAPGASNFCFGGADFKTLFITAGDKVMSAKLKTPALAGKK
ncbi:MAG: SMP-30/gluconolactonase/LRE family protein [Planctomycetota bacterium]